MDNYKPVIAPREGALVQEKEFLARFAEEGFDAIWSEYYGGYMVGFRYRYLGTVEMDKIVYEEEWLETLLFKFRMNLLELSAGI